MGPGGVRGVQGRVKGLENTFVTCGVGLEVSLRSKGAGGSRLVQPPARLARGEAAIANAGSRGPSVAEG